MRERRRDFSSRDHKLVHMEDSLPLRVESIEDSPSRSIVSRSGERVQLREAVSPGGEKNYIPEKMIVRVEDCR